MSPRAKKRMKRAYARNAFRNHAKRRQPNDLHTILSFCLANAISESKYYDLQRRGLGPRTIEIDGAVRIGPEAERDWRNQREAETTAKRQRQQATAGASP